MEKKGFSYTAIQRLNNCSSSEKSQAYLNVKSIETDCIDDRPEISVRERALRRTCNIVPIQLVTCHRYQQCCFTYFLFAPFDKERMVLTNVDKYCPEPPSRSRSMLGKAKQYPIQCKVTYPSKTALPKGRVELEPPRKRFQMVLPKDFACAPEEKTAAPVAPPRLSVTVLPLAWQALISAAIN